jgi:hypothetical protein
VKRAVVVAVLVVSFLALVPGQARVHAAPAAAASRVVLLRSGSADALPRQAQTLLAAELRATGFEVVSRERSAGGDLRADIEEAAAALRPIAVLAIATVAAGTAELWLSDRVTGKLVIRRIELGEAGGDDAAALALRSVELLRGSLLEITVEAPPTPRAPPPADVARFVAAAAPGHRTSSFLQGIGISLGGAVMAATSGVTWAPALRLGYGGRRLGLRLTAIGPGSGRDAPVRDGERLLGTAHLHRELVLAEALLAFRPDTRLQPFLSLGAGLHRLRVSGTPAVPLFSARDGTQLALALDAGAGVALRLGNRIALLLEAHLLATTPSTRVSVVDQPATSVGPLTALGSLSLSTSF